MISRPMISETIAVLTPSGINFPQTEKPKPASQRQDSLKKHLKAEIKVLGTIQIFCGVMVLSLGIILVLASFSPHFTEVFSSLLKAAYPFIGALCFVISGSLSIITGKKTTKPLLTHYTILGPESRTLPTVIHTWPWTWPTLACADSRVARTENNVFTCLWVQSSLAANLLSSLSALVGFILLSVNLAALGPALRKCDLTKEDTPEEHSYHFNSYDNVDCPIANAILAGALSVMLLCTVLEFCIGVLAAVLWWKQAHSGFLGSVIFLPQSYTYKSSMPPKADFDHGYEELLTS